MEYLEMLTAFVSLCQSALNMGKTIAPNLKRLRPEEKELLLAAEDGHFLLIDCGYMTLLSTCKQVWGDEKQPHKAALYLDAFESLCKRGLIRYIGKNHFQLTGAGFRLRDRLQTPSFFHRLFNRLRRLFSLGHC